MLMEKKCTTDDLILYLYNETPITETVLIQQDIDTDAETATAFEDLKAAQRMLNALLERPSNACFRSILRYSRGLDAAYGTAAVHGA